MDAVRDRTRSRQPLPRSRASSVRPISSIELTIDLVEGRDHFALSREEILRWINNRAGKPLPESAWNGASFELDDVGAQRTAAISIESPRYWAARLDDNDKNVAQRTWVTEIGVAEREDELVIGTHLSCVSQGENPAQEGSIPGFVRGLVSKFADWIYLEGQPLTMDPWIVRDERDAANLAALIEWPVRKLDVIVCSLPEGSNDPNDCPIDYRWLHTRTLGAAHVAVVTQSASYELSDRFGKALSTFRGAVRTYRPGFDSKLDEPHRHPLGMMNRIETWPDGGPASYASFIASQSIINTTRDRDRQNRIPHFADVKKAAAELKREMAKEQQAPDTELIALYEAETADLSRQLDEQKQLYEGLLKTAEEERSSAEEAARQANARIPGLQQRIEALVEQRGAPDRPIPTSLDELEAWAQQELSGTVELHSRALQGAKKSQFLDVELVYQSLLLLRDRYVPMRKTGGEALRAAFVARCQQLNIEEQPTFSGNRWAEEGDTYVVRFGGKRCLLDKHLKKGTSRDERYCFRLYFFWDEDTQQAVVGWLPSHLDTRIS